jgi:hypothetical protein
VLCTLRAKNRLQGFEIVVMEAADLGARKTLADDGAIVDELVVNDEIALAHQCADGGNVGGMPADER